MSFVSAHAKKPPNVKGIAMTVGIHVLVVAGIMSLPGIEVPERTFNTIFGKNIELDPPKPPPPPEEKPLDPEINIASKPVVTNPKPTIDLPKAPDVTPTPFTTSGDIVLAGSGIDDGIPIPPIDKIDPPVDPVITGAALNSRYASQFQPSYPTAMVRMEQEGVVSVRVLVGTDGRAKDIELISTPHEDFWNSTRKHALRKWRFKPATKDGKPYEAWITLKVRFELQA